MICTRRNIVSWWIVWISLKIVLNCMGNDRIPLGIVIGIWGSCMLLCKFILLKKVSLEWLKLFWELYFVLEAIKSLIYLNKFWYKKVDSANRSIVGTNNID